MWKCDPETPGMIGVSLLDSHGHPMLPAAKDVGLLWPAVFFLYIKWQDFAKATGSTLTRFRLEMDIISFHFNGLKWDAHGAFLQSHLRAVT